RHACCHSFCTLESAQNIFDRPHSRCCVDTRCAELRDHVARTVGKAVSKHHGRSKQTLALGKSPLRDLPPMIVIIATSDVALRPALSSQKLTPRPTANCPRANQGRRAY